MDVLAIRKSLGLTQSALAERLGVTQSTVSRWERGDLETSPRDRLALRALQIEAATPQAPGAAA